MIKEVHSLNGYQERAYATLTCPDEHLDAYLPLQLCAEAGEVAAKFAKPLRRGQEPGVSNNLSLAYELGDVLWYVAVLAEHLGFDLEDIANLNLHKLKDRKDRGVLCGDGDNR